MTPAREKARTGFLAGALLFAVGLAGIFSAQLASLIGSTLAVNDLPSVLALACGYCSLVAIATSLVDRADRDAAVGAYRLVGRWFVWTGAGLAAISIGLFVTRTRYADDLLKPDKLFFVAAVGVPLIVFFAYLLQRTGKAEPAVQRAMPAAGRSRIKVGVAIVLSLVAGLMLYQRYSEKLSRDAGYATRDEAARRASKPWTLEFDALRGGMTVPEVSALALQSGHVLKCYGDLRSEERIKEDDKNVCWVTVGEVWGIPALWTQFNFGDDGLRYQFIHFPAASWPQIERTLDATGRRLPQTFGLDLDTHRPISGWRFASGLANAVAPRKGGEVLVMWVAPREIARDYCASQALRPRGDRQGPALQLAELWPEIDCAKPR